MIDDLEIEIYIIISSNLFGIYSLDIKNNKYLYKQELKISSENKKINFENFDTFLQKNIFKIEKLIGKFIKNISLIVEDKLISNIEFGIKKKTYEEFIEKKSLENLISDAKNLFQENFNNEKIIHILVNKYLVDGKQYPLNENNLSGEYFCMEFKFICISNDLKSQIEDILEKYQIEIVQFFDGNYLKKFFQNKSHMEISEMAYKIQCGLNENEVKLVPKNIKKTGFFEKFFQLFS